MDNELLLSLIFFVSIFGPAYLANGSPVLFKLIKDLKILFKYPIDFGFILFGERLIGNNKTWIGLFVGVLGGSIGSLILYLLGYYRDYSIFNCLYIGAVLGFGAMFGDLFKSFIKRRFEISPGKSWPIFDQLDFVVGAWVFSGFIWPFSITKYAFVIAVFITPPLHFIANWGAYKLKWKKVWW